MSDLSAATYREMTIEDCSVVAELEQLLGATSWGQSLFEGEFGMDPNHRTWFVAEIDSEIIGFAGIAHVLGEANILNIGVTPAKQRSGLGRVLAQKLLDTSISKQCHKVMLEVETTNDKAIRLYESLGFSSLDVRSDYYGKGRDAQVMIQKSI